MLKIFKSIIISFVICLINTGNVYAETFTLTQCIDIALKSQPQLISSLALMNAVQARIGQAQSAYFPAVNLSAGYDRIGSGFFETSHNQYSAGLSLTQNIFDFGRASAAVDIAHYNLESSSSDYNNNISQVVFNVKQAYYTMVKSMKNLEVASEAVKQYSQHLNQAKEFYAVGVKAKIDVTKANVDYSNAKLKLTTAKNALTLSMVNLKKTMGIVEPKEFTIDDKLTINSYNLTVDSALIEAIDNRADLKTASAKTKSAEMTARLNKKNYYPTITGKAYYNWQDLSAGVSSSSKTDSFGWGIGAQINFALFNGFITKKQIEEASLNHNAVRANEESIRQNIISEVQLAYINLTDAWERIPEALEVVQQAKENIDIANGRYSTGVGSPIEVTDAEITYENAKLAHIAALIDYKISEASIEKAIGVK